jgi:hypothetical protein
MLNTVTAIAKTAYNAIAGPTMCNRQRSGEAPSGSVVGRNRLKVMAVLLGL